MSNTRPTPYLEGKAGDLITAARWNEVQVQTREEIASSVAQSLAAHEVSRHTGDPDNPKVKSLTADAVTAAALTATTLNATTLNATNLTGGAVKATSLSSGSVAADTVKAGALSVKTLEVTDKLALSGVSGVLTPRVYAAHLVYGSGSQPFSSAGSFSWQGNTSPYGPYFHASSTMGYWIGVPPQLTLKLETAGLLQLWASWQNYTGSGSWGWAQFVIGSGGKFAPVRTPDSPIYGDNNSINSIGYTRPSLPTAATFQAWLDYHWTIYNNYSYRWPLAGISFYNGNYSTFTHQDAIEVPAGTYTLNLGFSGVAYVASLQLRATFFPGGTAST